MTFKLTILIAALAVLIRVGYVAVSGMEGGIFRNISFFSLPVLESLSLLVLLVGAVLPQEKRAGIVSFGMTMMAAVAVNASLRIVDHVRIFETCEAEGFGGYESICEGVVMQNLCNGPFLLIAAVIAFWVWRR